MGVKKLVYLANARLPTEKAHGYQICKMCEAFAQNSVEVVLMHPYRYQFDPRLRGQNVFDYYGVQRIFSVRILPNLDVVLLNHVLPDRLFTPVFFAHAVLWGLYATLVARKEKAEFYFTRDSRVAFWLVQFGLPTVYESHVPPKRGEQWLIGAISERSSLCLIVALANSVRQKWLQVGVSPEKLVVLPHGVDLTLFHNLPSQQECRRLLNLPLERPIIGYIGRFQGVGSEKGIPELLGAISHLPSINGTEPLLLCVGGPMDAVSSYYDLAQEMGISRHRLKFIDRVPNREVPFWIRACDVAALPLNPTYADRVGTMPLKLFEYMAAGTPIVATDLPVLREILRDGDNAVLVQASNPRALANAIKTVLERPILRVQLAEQAMKDVKKFTWQGRAKQIMQAFDIIASARLHDDARS